MVVEVRAGFFQLGKRFSRLWLAAGLHPDQQSERIQNIQRNIALPIRAILICLLFYFFYFTPWTPYPSESSRMVVIDSIRSIILGYILINVSAAVIFYRSRKLPAGVVSWLLFTLGILDGFILACLTFVTDGFDSPLFWIFLGLIASNAINVPMAGPQIILNLLVSLFYFVSGVIDVAVTTQDIIGAEDFAEETAEPFLLRIIVLLLWTFWCYAVQKLAERKRRAEEEAAEFQVKQQQLQTAGRMAAEIAHQLKNPLGIISNAAFSLQRSGTDSVKAPQQFQVIREEVERADRIITELMGFAQLAEGKVERLHVNEELNQAIERVFPAGVEENVKIVKEFAAELPPILMQKPHFSEVAINLLQNAREAIAGNGKVTVKTLKTPDSGVEIHVIDNGPGIETDKIERVWEPYFTTKQRGTGLGLAIVKRHMELYGGTARAFSELGKGAKFVLTFPGKRVPKL